MLVVRLPVVLFFKCSAFWVLAYENVTEQLPVPITYETNGLHLFDK